MPETSRDEERERFVEDVFAGVAALLDARLGPVLSRLAALETRPAPLKGEPGKDAAPVDVPAIVKQVREDAYDALQKLLDEDLPTHVTRALASLPRPKDGDPGKDADEAAIVARVQQATMQAVEQDLPYQLSAAVQAAVAALPKPKDGDPGKDAEFDPSLVTLAVERCLPAAVAAAAESIAERTQGSLEAGLAALELRVTNAVAAIPVPNDGVSPDPDQVAQKAWAMLLPSLEQSVATAVLEAVSQIPVPKNGEPGKNADPVDYVKVSDWVTKRIREEFEERKPYLRGEPGPPGIGKQGEPGVGKRGKEGPPGRDAFDPEHVGRVVTAQLSKALSGLRIEIKQEGRDVVLSAMLGDEVVGQQRAHFKVPLYKGVFKPGTTYEAGDMVTDDGSIWHLNADVSTERPSASGNGTWTLANKRGRDGKGVDDVRPATGSPDLRIR